MEKQNVIVSKNLQIFLLLKGKIDISLSKITYYCNEQPIISFFK